jgi:hypothetical protein
MKPMAGPSPAIDRSNNDRQATAGSSASWSEIAAVGSPSITMNAFAMRVLRIVEGLRAERPEIVDQRDDAGARFDKVHAVGRRAAAWSG